MIIENTTVKKPETKIVTEVLIAGGGIAGTAYNIV